MNKVVFISFLFFFSLCHAQASDYHKHIVAKGETIAQIAERYQVTPFDIHQLNPDAKSGLKEKAVLLIPKTSVAAKARIHEVKPGETFYSIAKKYNITNDQLEKANPSVDKFSLSIGQQLQLPGASVGTQKAKEIPAFHEVQPKETFYSIAKLYGVSVSELEVLNPEVMSNLPVGYSLRLTANKTNTANTAVEKNSASNTKDSTRFVWHIVQPKATIFGISKEFGLSQVELLKWNPDLESGLQEGMTLRIPKPTSATPPTSSSAKMLTDLSKSSKVKETKEIAILLPFNVSSIATDTTLSTQARLKRDGFLNMTLDVYSGVLMAIDSAKRIGLPLHVTILDSKETRNNSDVVNLVNAHQLKNVDAIIGPFYPQYVEKVAQLVSEYNVPVISPLRETTKSYKNLYQSMPSGDFVKSSMLEYLQSKKGTIIALIDNKRNATRKLIEKEFKSVYIVPLNDKGGLVGDSIAPRLQKNKTNYFVLDTGSTGMIFAALNQCNNARANGYKVELVVLEINDTFETDEVFPRLVRQKIIFPSLTRFQETPENTQFANAYRKKNNVYPNQYALRGFDLTFDVMQRVLLTEGFENSVKNTVTIQIENKFDYYQRADSGYSNKGIFIHQYQEDYTIKELD